MPLYRTTWRAGPSITCLMRQSVSASAAMSSPGEQSIHPIRRYIMAKRGRKKRDRKHSKANHGNRPNAGGCK